MSVCLSVCLASSFVDRLHSNFFLLSFCSLSSLPCLPLPSVAPLIVIEFLHRVMDIFTEYFSECTEQRIKEHYVIVYEVSVVWEGGDGSEGMGGGGRHC